jgi:hypothetical protein
METRYWIGLALIVALFFPVTTNLKAETFDVSDVAGFQTALNTAAANQDNDIINVAEGTYAVTSRLTYSSDENFSLTISGAGNTKTFLDGGSANQVLWLSSVGTGDLFMDNIVIQNGAGDYGAGLYADTDTATIMLTSVRFIDNTATEVGGGANIYSNSGTLRVTGCGFNGNSSVRAGGLFAQSETGPLVHVTYCSFLSNSVTVDGGACMLYPLGTGADVVSEDNNFSGNGSGEFGGGCWIRTPGGSNTISYRNNNHVNNHSVAGDGGGAVLEIFSGSITFSGNTHRMNSTGLNGGGAWIWLGSGTMDLSDSIFLDNAASTNGGGADISTDSGTVVISNMMFADNQADGVGGGVSLSCGNATVAMVNNAFFDSRSVDGGGGITFYTEEPGVTLQVVNQIIWNSTPVAIAQTGTGSVIATWSDIENGTGEPWFGTGCISVDPLYVAPDTGDLHIQTGSPCIDAADGTLAPDYDFDGHPRYDDPATANTGNGPPWADMGADEYNPVDPTRTPAANPTPTPTSIPGDYVGLGLDMGAHSFDDGDTCYLYLSIVNNGPEVDVDLYVLLDVFGYYWCYPGWLSLTEQLDWETLNLPAGESGLYHVIDPFTMPPVGAAGPFYFYAVMFNQGYLDISQIVSNVATWEFYLL